ncbi:MAG TPA: hydrogenase maturation protease [Thermoanaerobaculia bacterium]|nr:hydrogenase maturation protease [Thermoanaerobaculia bacterium]
MRILIAGVGYSNLSDMSLGPLLIEILTQRAWPEGVEIDDLSYGPVFICHSLGERPAYDRIVLIGAVSREEAPGTIRRFRWAHELPSTDEIQARVVEAATGVTSLENLLVVSTYFKRLPADVVVLEIEPFVDTFGAALSDDLNALLPAFIEELTRVWSSPDPLPLLETYRFIIANPADRPTGWIIREADWGGSN